MNKMKKVLLCILILISTNKLKATNIKHKPLKKNLIQVCSFFPGNIAIGQNVITKQIKDNLYRISGDIMSNICIKDHNKGHALAVNYRPFDKMADHQLVDVELYADDGFYYKTLRNIISHSYH